MYIYWLVVSTYPSEKYEFVSWDYEIPNIWKNKIHVPNHQPLMYVYTVCVCIYIYISTIYPTLSLATNRLAHGNPSCNPQFMARTEPEKKVSRTSCDNSSTPSFCVTFLPLHPNRPTECCKKRSAFADFVQSWSKMSLIWSMTWKRFAKLPRHDIIYIHLYSRWLVMRMLFPV